MAVKMKLIIADLLNRSTKAQIIVLADKTIVYRNTLFNDIMHVPGHCHPEEEIAQYVLDDLGDKWKMKKVSGEVCICVVEKVTYEDGYTLVTLEEETADVGECLADDAHEHPVWIADKEGKINSCNQAAKQFHNATSLFEIVPWALVDYNKKEQSIYCQNDTHRYELQLVSGKACYVVELVSCHKVFPSENDIQRMLQLSEECYAIHDMEHVYFANQAMHDLLQLPAGQLNGEQLHEYVTEADLMILKQAQEEESRTWYRAVRIKTAEGLSQDVTCAILPIRLAGKAVFVSMLKKPITPYRREEAMDVVSRLAASMAHEIRNPLTSIKGFMQFFSEKDLLPQSFFHVTKQELERIEQIVSEYAFLARTQDREEVTEFCMKAFFQSLLKTERMKAVAVTHPIEWVSKAPVFITGCKKDLLFMFEHLIQNAADASEPGTPIVLETDIGEHDIRVCVVDEGVGIPEERLHVIGQPFYSTKEKGTGLGLMICYTIAEMHGGAVDVQSEIGIGTRVSVFLPRTVYHKPSSSHFTVKEPVAAIGE
ncbi:HAMP domain-containing sensor histidine kinase [Bacillus sp. FSL W7-1360]